MILRKKGFTLVEMLAVIAIIAILAAALLPAIQNAIDSAKATALKTNGRGVWAALISANSERDPLGKTALWPNLVASNTTATLYFKYLMSDGSPFPGVVQSDPNQSLCSDITPSKLAGGGIGAASSPLLFDHGFLAWNVFAVDNTMAGDAPLFITKNVTTFTPGSTTAIASNSVATLSAQTASGDPTPFGPKRAVWVSIGGSCSDARAKYFHDSTLLITTTNTYAMWVP